MFLSMFPSRLPSTSVTDSELLLVVLSFSSPLALFLSTPFYSLPSQLSVFHSATPPSSSPCSMTRRGTLSKQPLPLSSYKVSSSLASLFLSAMCLPISLALSSPPHFSFSPYSLCPCGTLLEQALILPAPQINLRLCILVACASHGVYV